MSAELLWPIALGLLLSAVVQSLVSRGAVAQALGINNARSVLLASAMGAASSSCSYAAAALARSFFQKGATLANAIIFEFGSTNLVFDLGVVVFALLGWQFLVAQYLGGALMIVCLALLFKFTLKPALEQSAHTHAQRGLAGKMEGHAGMDMSVAPGPLLRRILSSHAFTVISHYFYMDLLGLLPDLLLGIFIASILGVLVPDRLWQSVFFTNNPSLAFFWGPIVGPLISMASFVCSIGNVPLSVVLWRGGISFGGVISFIFADLLILPILNIYRKYYGIKAAVYLLVVSYVSMVLSGMLVEIMFSYLGIVPARSTVQALQAEQLHLNYTTILDLVALAAMALLAYRFLTTGGPAMLKQMEEHSSSGLNTGDHHGSCHGHVT